MSHEQLGRDLAEVRRRFDAACEALRPDLHRFCTRMTGSPCDGEDVVHETLALAFYRLSELREADALRAWLFRIAHRKCLDFLRARRAHEPLDADRPDEESPMDEELDRKRRVEHALARIVVDLPPRERACVLLKDVLDCSLEETAEITGSNVGAVKAALHRGRQKLEDAERGPLRRAPIEPHRRAVIARYVEAFDRRDWDGVRALLSEDATLDVVHRSQGRFASSSYFTNYGKLEVPWRLSLAWVDGVESVVQFRQIDGRWVPHAVVIVEVEGDRVVGVRDFVHVDYVLAHAHVEEASPP